MKELRIVFASVTYAEKGKAMLAAQGIRARIVRLDPKETPRGCTYALAVSDPTADPIMLRNMLEAGHIRYTEIL